MSKLTDFVKNLNEANGNHLYSFSVLGDGVNEKYESSPRARCHNVYSVAKTFTTTLVGIAFDAGLLRPEDKISDFLGKYFPENIDRRWYDTTVDNALLHRIGLADGFLDIDALDSRKFGSDYLEYMLKADLICDPGTAFHYTDGTFYLLARVVEECFKPENLTAFLWEKLFSPLEFQEFAWSQCPKGHILGGSDLYISSEDCVKLGELYRNGGEFNGKKVISKEWADMVFAREYEFGFNPKLNMHAKGGYSGQFLAVFPSKKLSAAWQGFGCENMTEQILNFINDEM